MNDDQRRAALRRANDVRMSRSRIKRSLKNGDLQIIDAIDDPSVAGMTIAQLFAFTPGPGRPHSAKYPRPRSYRRVERQLRRIDPTRTVGNLTPRERAALSAWTTRKEVC